MCTDTLRRERGFTLPELVLLIVVLGMALAGIVSLFMTTVAGSADPLVRKQAIAIAESFMDEIMTQALSEPSPATPRGATRESFDSIQDYVGYSETGIKSFSGTAVTGLENYNVGFGVADDTVNGAAVKLVTVTVTGPGGVTFTLQGYKGF
jgi:MSHA pilin protein MshD